MDEGVPRLSLSHVSKIAASAPYSMSVFKAERKEVEIKVMVSFVPLARRATLDRSPPLGLIG